MEYEFKVILEVDGKPKQFVSLVSDTSNASIEKVFGDLERGHPGAKLLSLTYHHPRTAP